MYNIHAHYENIFQWAKRNVPNPRVVYLHPFGTSSIENIESLVDSYSKHQGPIIFCYDQEPLIRGYNEKLFQHVKDTFGTLSSPIILLNTEQDSDAKTYFLEKFGFVDAYTFFHIFAAHDWYRGYQFYPQLINIEDRKINKKYITFNRLTGNTRCYRSFFVADLQNKGILNQGYVSYSDVCPVHGHYSEDQGLVFANKWYGIPEEEVTKAKTALDQITLPLRIDHKTENSIPNGSMQVGAIDQCMESFLYVVTETCFWDTKKHLTEKIFKPVITKQPFVLLGCVHNLDYFKQYGFKTFDKWWDESYDSIENPIERIKAVTAIIESICNKSDEELEYILLDMQETLDHNFNVFNSQDFLQKGWNELTSNLLAAFFSTDSLSQSLIRADVDYKLADKISENQ